jgi:putative heme-binding domain-containing protein
VTELFQQFDGKDRSYLEALGMALEGKEATAYVHIFAGQNNSSASWSEAYAALAWRLHPKEAVTALKERAMAEGISDSLRLLATDALAFIADKEAVAAMLELEQSEPGSAVSKLAIYWLSHRKNNDWYALWDWESLEKGDRFLIPIEIAQLQKRLLDENEPTFKRIRYAKQLARTAVGGRLLISLAASGELPKEYIKAASGEIFNNPEQDIRTLASEYFEKPGGMTYAISSIVSLKGDFDKGEKIFSNNCITCHKIGDKGKDIGPKLATVGEKFDKVALLDAILNPSAAIAFGFESVLLKTKSGQAFYGFLLSEGKTTVIKDIAGNQIVVKTEDIESKQQMKTSIMPDASSLGLKEQDLADLTTYLLNLK